MFRLAPVSVMVFDRFLPTIDSLEWCVSQGARVVDSWSQSVSDGLSLKSSELGVKS